MEILSAPKGIDPRLSFHAIATAERNAKAQLHLYRVLFSVDGYLPDVVFVERTETVGREVHSRYAVQLDARTLPISCTCRAHQQSGVCKHQYMVAMRQEEAALELAEQEYAQREDGLEYMAQERAERGFLAASGQAESRCRICNDWLFDDGTCLLCEERRLEWMSH